MLWMLDYFTDSTARKRQDANAATVTVRMHRESCRKIFTAEAQRRKEPYMHFNK
jgi:hypothetical protein